MAGEGYQEAVLNHIDRVQNKACNDPVFAYLEWRSLILHFYVARNDIRTCPVCGEAVIFNSYGATEHYSQVPGAIDRHTRRIDGSAAFYDLYWGWECKSMLTTPWTTYLDDIPGLERFARWWQAVYRSQEVPSIAELFLFISRDAWRSRCIEVRVKQGKNMMREIQQRLQKERQRRCEEESYLYVWFGKKASKYPAFNTDEARRFARNMITLSNLKRRLKNEPSGTNVSRKQ